MGILERSQIKWLIIIMILLCMLPCITVNSEEQFTLYDEIPSDAEENQYIQLITYNKSYEVKAGDSLWEISENIWGDGSLYPLLFECNEQLVQNQGFIYPGMVLETSKKVYIKKQTGNTGIKSKGQYYIDAPYEWSFGILEAGDAFANFALYDSGINGVVCLLSDKKQSAVNSLKDWEEFQKQVREYINQNYKDVVSELSFERYKTQTGEDVYLYSFEYCVDLSKYGIENTVTRIHVCQGIKQTENLQAELTGFCFDNEICNIVRYMTASFEDLTTKNEKAITINDSNIMISPSVDWEISGIHNPFSWIEAYFHGVLCEVTDTPLREKSTEEKLLDYMHEWTQN